MKYNFLFLLLLFLGMASCRPEPPLEKMETEKKDTTEMVVKVRKDLANEIALGKRLYEGKCDACHVTCVRLIGPPLIGSRERWNNDEKLYDFTVHPERYYDSDPYVMRLKAWSNGAIMSLGWSIGKKQ